MDKRIDLTVFMSASLPWISPRKIFSRTTIFLTSRDISHRSSSPRDSGCGSWRKLHSLIRECQNRATPRYGRTHFNSVTVIGVRSGSRFSRRRAAVLSLLRSSACELFFAGVTFLFPHAGQTRDQIIDNKMLILLGRCSENLLDAQFIAVRYFSSYFDVSSTFLEIFSKLYNYFQLQFNIIDIFFSIYFIIFNIYFSGNI